MDKRVDGSQLLPSWLLRDRQIRERRGHVLDDLADSLVRQEIAQRPRSGPIADAPQPLTPGVSLSRQREGVEQGMLRALIIECLRQPVGRGGVELEDRSWVHDRFPSVRSVTAIQTVCPRTLARSSQQS